ncbi:MAG: hypothetical protein NT013_12805 [Planctomycetia bacterium]|nr:hypothetical protein [Planctomycetia bacterium]
MADFNAYHKWLGIPPEEQPPNYYRLLGIALFEKDRDVIIAALDQRQVYLKQKSVGPRGELAEPLLQELQKARLCLLNRLTKAHYDSTLREQGITAPVPAITPNNPKRVQERAHTDAPMLSASGPSARADASGNKGENVPAHADGFQFPTEGDVDDVSVKSKRMEQRSRRISWTINAIVASAVAGGIWWLTSRGVLPPPGELLDPTKEQRVVARNSDELEMPTADESDSPDMAESAVKTKPETATTSITQKPAIPKPPKTRVENESVPEKTQPAVKPSIAVPQGTDELRFADHRTPIVDFALSADGQLLATAGPGGDCRIWSIATGETVAHFSGHDGQVHAVAFAAKGNQVLSSGETLKLWNSTTGKETAELKTNRRPVRAMLFWPNNRQVATVGAGAIEVWDISTRKQVRLIPGCHPFCGSLAITEDGLTLAATSGEEAEVATLFQTTTGKILKSFVGHKSRISSLALSKDGLSLWTASNEHVGRRWDTKTSKTETLFAHADVLALSSDEKLLATGGLNGLVSIWNAQTGSGLLQLPRLKLQVLDIAFLPNGEHILIAGDSLDKSGSTATIQLWTLPKIDPNAPGSRPNSIPIADATADDTPTKPSPTTKPATNGEPESVTKKVPVPSDEQRDESEKLIKDLFKQDFAKALRLADKADLAAKLFEQAKTTNDDPAGKYVLLQEASDLAVIAGEFDLTEKIVSELTTQFEVDAIDAKSKRYKQLSATVKSGAPQEQLAEAYLKLAEECATASRFDTAIESTKTAVLLAGKAKNLTLRESAKAKTDEYSLKKKSGDGSEPYRAALSKNPDDPVANERLGKHLCFVKDDWPAGLPHLAKSENLPLKFAAELELTNPEENAKMIELGDSWWELAKDFTETDKTAANRRSQFWYLKAINELKGLDKIRIKVRLGELEKLKLDRESPDDG